MRGFVPVLAAAGLASGCGGPGPAPAPPSQHFVSRPDLRPVPVSVLTRAHGTAPGYVFLAPKKDVAQAGPLILDDRGQVVWFDPLETHGVTDFRVQSYRGKRVLTWWQGQSDHGVGNGHYVIMDHHYRRIATVQAGNGLHGDTALITVYRQIPYDLSAWGGAKQGTLDEGVVQEIDIATGRVLFEWHSAGHVDPSESYQPLPKDTSTAWDYFHVNSIDPDGSGRLLVSARHTHAVYEIRKSDRRILWRLGGKKSDFTPGPGTRFAWQHDARRLPDGTIMLFDNASDPGKARSKVLVIRVDEQGRTATLVRSYVHSPPLLSTSQGNAQPLPDNHVFVGWGSNPYATEYDRTGDVLFDLHFGVGRVDSYRAFRFTWTGLPTTPPAVALRPAGDRTTVYASWN